MELYNTDNTVIISDREKKLKILNDSDYRFRITGPRKDNKLSGMSFKITEHDRKMYKVFRDFYNSLVEVYNEYKEFHDYNYEEFPLFDEKHNWFTFYDDYSSVNEGNIFRIIKNEKMEPYTIGIYIRNNSNRLHAHTLAKSGSRYPEFGECFRHLLLDLEKLEKEKTYTKKKEV